MTELYILQKGPVVDKLMYCSISVFNNESCDSVLSNGKAVHRDSPFIGGWLYLEPTAALLWTGDFKEENGLLLGLVEAP
jgi:hypothetical protein